MTSTDTLTNSSKGLFGPVAVEADTRREVLEVRSRPIMRGLFFISKVSCLRPTTHAEHTADINSELVESIRGEDFDITYRSKNRFRFMGNGYSQHEANGGNLGFYLKK